MNRSTEIALPTLVAILAAVGLFTLSSAAPSGEIVTRQLLYLALGIGVAAAILFLGRRRLYQLAYVFFAIEMGLLILTRFIGVEVGGARSWLNLPVIPQFQPSELAKFAVILAMGRAYEDRRHHGSPDYVVPLLFGLPPILLVATQPDVGGAFLLSAVAFVMVAIHGTRWQHVAIALVAVGVLLPTVAWPALNPARQGRILAYLNPASDPRGAGYQVIQSTIAVGSGGLTGKGYRQGTQSQLGFIPLRHNDFIFAVWAEETGLFGSVLLLGLFGLILWRLSGMAMEAGSPGDRQIIVGVFALLGLQVLINVGVSTGVAPVTGLTLPLVSAGGSSVITTLALLALVYAMHRDTYDLL